jgi:hypothetical protein
MRGRMGGMKHPPKVHWHAYLMLSIGIVFLLLACADYFAHEHLAGRPIRIHEDAYGSGYGNTFAIIMCAGVLCTGIGIYAVRRHKD